MSIWRDRVTVSPTNRGLERVQLSMPRWSYSKFKVQLGVQPYSMPAPSSHPLLVLELLMDAPVVDRMYVELALYLRETLWRCCLDMDYLVQKSSRSWSIIAVGEG
jgi:hypothetical protein